MPRGNPSRFNDKGVHLGRCNFHSSQFDRVLTVHHVMKSVYCVVMRIQWTPMGQGKSEEHPSYEESTV
ncbi:hypothetical protein Taro_007257 [Colocasia esculenta]|uniref:Uncharacterized protein n=1 Tax=Colocasia esculenta TaxID=4460 RepID=A0A843TUY7_COLES|nr:hypothetical protein [Colocasia esculenta]